MDGWPTDFWGKFQALDEVTGRRRAWHPLNDHCADVAAVLEALLGQRVIRQRLACLSGRDDLTKGQIARLSYIACLHDLGKFNTGFQRKIRPGAIDVAGHVTEVWSLLQDEYAERAAAALRFDQLAAWCEEHDQVSALLVGSFSHHGAPLNEVPKSKRRPRLWRPADGVDPLR